MVVSVFLGFFAALALGARLERPRREPVPVRQIGMDQKAGSSPNVAHADSQRQPGGAVYPRGYNFALAANGATAEGGHGANLLIDGDDTSYNGGSGFAYSNWKTTPAQFFTIKLKSPVTLDSIRFLLWDQDDRYYRYTLEICADEKGEKWMMAADRSAETDHCKSWQPIQFEPQTVKQIRLTGTFNSSNNEFHVVELQAFYRPLPLKEILDF